jgi:hypothetical protein
MPAPTSPCMARCPALQRAICVASSILIKDHAGVDAGTVGLTRFDGKTNETDDFSVKGADPAGTIHVDGNVSGCRDRRRFVWGSDDANFLCGEASHDERSRLGRTIGRRDRRKFQAKDWVQVFQRVPVGGPRLRHLRSEWNTSGERIIVRRSLARHQPVFCGGRTPSAGSRGSLHVECQVSGMGCGDTAW